MNLSFPTQHECGFDPDCVAFPATLDGRPIVCRISYETLMSRFRSGGPSDRDAVTAFLANRDSIESLVRNALSQLDTASVTEIEIRQNEVRVK